MQTLEVERNTYARNAIQSILCERTLRGIDDVKKVFFFVSACFFLCKLHKSFKESDIQMCTHYRKTQNNNKWNPFLEFKHISARLSVRKMIAQSMPCALHFCIVRSNTLRTFHYNILRSFFVRISFVERSNKIKHVKWEPGYMLRLCIFDLK